MLIYTALVRLYGGAFPAFWRLFYSYIGLFYNLRLPWRHLASMDVEMYGVTTISRLLQIIGLFCSYIGLFYNLSLPWRHLASMDVEMYGVTTISRLLQIIGLFCKRALKKRLYSAIETYNWKEPTNHSHPIGIFFVDM